MRSTKTIQSRQVIHSVINQVKVNESLTYSVIRQYPSLALKKRYFDMESARNEEN